MSARRRGRRPSRGHASQLGRSTGRSRRRSGLGREASPSPGRFQARFAPQPDGPGPQSQSLSRSYGSNLPTSLTYIVLPPEAVHLGDLLRIWVRSGTKITPPSQVFQGPAGAHPTAQEPRCFTGARALSPSESIPGRPPLTKKRELFREPPPASPGAFALPRWCPRAPSPCPGSGILTRFPFDSRRALPLLAIHGPPFRNGVPLSLRTD